MEQQAKKPISEKIAYQRMARVCSMKECCSFDIRQKLQRMQLEDEVINRIVLLLLKQKYIDDTRFSRSFINDKLRFSKWGKTKIEFALRQKQVPQEVIDEAFEEFSDELLTQSLKPLLEKKLKSVKGKTEYEKRTKVIRFGLSRGFAMHDILKCLGKTVEDY
ncbi:MAG: regulatory protein RecX [Bacteroidia bacterium]|nr:regulatory protein RecX [Bacteroidia bacterium]